MEVALSSWMLVLSSLTKEGHSSANKSVNGRLRRTLLLDKAGQVGQTATSSAQDAKNVAADKTAQAGRTTSETTSAGQERATVYVQTGIDIVKGAALGVNDAVYKK